MSCERYRRAITEHSYGAALPEPAADHLASCEKCGALRDESRALLQSFEDDLQRALAVDASPGFERGVRLRVQDASSRSTRVWWWSLAGVPVAVSIVLLLSLWPSVPTSSSSMPALPAAPIARAPALNVPALGLDLSRVQGQPAATRSARRRSLPPVDVMVPPDHAQALSRFMTLVRDGNLDTSTLPAASTSEPSPPDDLVLAPLTIDPIPVPDMEIPLGPAASERRPH
jgi:hypothetical protein